MLVLVCVIVIGLIIIVIGLSFVGLSLATMGRIHLDWGSIPSRDFSFKVYMK
jgi:ABC-type dipeptide/oligopeptide/nickel transport system permease subunit